MQRKNRLSRSRDFDAVYRHGRSASTRFLTLHWFERSSDDDAGEPRLGLAVPRAAGNAVVRNRIKRQLREIWRAKLDAGALPAAPAAGVLPAAPAAGALPAWLPPYPVTDCARMLTKGSTSLQAAPVTVKVVAQSARAKARTSGRAQ